MARESPVCVLPQQAPPGRRHLLALLRQARAWSQALGGQNSSRAARQAATSCSYFHALRQGGRLSPDIASYLNMEAPGEHRQAVLQPTPPRGTPPPRSQRRWAFLRFYTIHWDPKTYRHRRQHPLESLSCNVSLEFTCNYHISLASPLKTESGITEGFSLKSRSAARVLQCLSYTPWPIKSVTGPFSSSEAWRLRGSCHLTWWWKEETGVLKPKF